MRSPADRVPPKPPAPMTPDRAATYGRRFRAAAWACAVAAVPAALLTDSPAWFVPLVVGAVVLRSEASECFGWRSGWLAKQRQDAPPRPRAGRIPVDTTHVISRPLWRRRYQWSVVDGDRERHGWAWTETGAKAAAYVAVGELTAARSREGR